MELDQSFASSWDSRVPKQLLHIYLEEIRIRRNRKTMGQYLSRSVVWYNNLFDVTQIKSDENNSIQIKMKPAVSRTVVGGMKVGEWLFNAKLEETTEDQEPTRPETHFVLGMDSTIQIPPQDACTIMIWNDGMRTIDSTLDLKRIEVTFFTPEEAARVKAELGLWKEKVLQALEPESGPMSVESGAAHASTDNSPHLTPSKDYQNDKEPVDD